MNTSDNINEAKKHLNSVDADGSRIYKELSYDCTEKFVRYVGEAVGEATINKVIDGDPEDLLLWKFNVKCKINNSVIFVRRMDELDKTLYSF